MAIIAILAALLLPALGTGKNHAAKASDMDNLRQIMVAVHLYCSDQQDVLPPPNWDNGGFSGPQGTNTGWLYEVDLEAAGTNRFQVDTGLLWNTLRSPKMYLCPMDNPSAAVFVATNNDWETRPQQISTYAMNGGVIGYMDMVYPPQRMSAMWSQACAFWETDERYPKFFNDGANYPPEGVSGRHLAGGVQALFDASVSYVKTNTWYQDEADPNKNRLWCYPLTSNGRE
jgi:type II secretory pathway pseudopilin PulG